MRLGLVWCGGLWIGKEMSLVLFFSFPFFSFFREIKENPPLDGPGTCDSLWGRFYYYCGCIRDKWVAEESYWN